MRERTLAIGRLVALVLATILMIFFKPAQDDFKQAMNVDFIKTDATVAAAPKPSAPTSTLPAAKATEAPAVQPQPAPGRPTPWAIQNSPNGGTDNVNKALALYQDMGLTKQGAAMLIGNFLQEKPSAFATGDPCGGVPGDGGLAEGLGQWHPGRRADMPCGFTDQLKWAVDVEMVRDNERGGGHNLAALLRDPNATTGQLDAAIKAWERYGTKGARYEYGIAVLAQLN